DPDLTPLPTTVTAVQARLQATTDTADPTTEGIEHDDAGHADTGHADAANTSTMAGEADQETVATPRLEQRATTPLRPAALPPGGVGLTGVGAADAARGILTATLLASRPTRPEHDTHVITTITDLHTLLGP